MPRSCAGLAIALAVAFFTFLLDPSAAAPDPNIAATDPRSPAEELKGFHLPPGFDIELVAAEPAIHKPINLNFDDRGRLWVTETVEYPYPAPANRKPRDAVKILEDTKGNGTFDKVTTFADELNIPIGILPVTGGAIVYSIPYVYMLRETLPAPPSQGGEKHEVKRDVLLSGFGFNDTHGMIGSFTRGFDGWVYMHHGFSNTSTVKKADGVETIRMQSGNTFRMTPDGTRVEQFTWGQVNPFGLCFDPLGNLYSADCHTRPAMMLLRGGWYESFGRPHDGLGYAPSIMNHDHGSTAIAGICYYAAHHFPAEFRGNIFMGNVVTNRINRDTLERHGSTYRAVQQPDFLKSDDPWFRPVDIKLGPDGALYVADFYNRIIGHYEVPLSHPGRDRERGRIWRIVYRGKDGKNQAVWPRHDWTKASIAELIEDLAHPNLTVRMKATHQLVERDKDKVKEALDAAKEPKPTQRVHGLWVLERQGQLANEALTNAAKDEAPEVRVHALRVLAERAKLDDNQHELVVKGLSDEDGFVQRAAADALGRHPAVDNVKPLLEVRHKAPAKDTLLLHTVRMALRNQLKSPESWAKLPVLGKKDQRAVADVAPGVHTAEAAAFLLSHVQKVKEGSPNLVHYLRHIARFGKDDLTTALLKFAQENKSDDFKHQAALFKAIQQGTQERGSKLNQDAITWGEELAGNLLKAKDSGQQGLGVELAGSLKLASTQEPLIDLLKNKETVESVRKSAASALVGIDAKKHVELLAEIIQDAGQSLPLREHLANVLAGTNLAEARASLIKALGPAPARLQTIIAMGLAGSKEGASQLLNAIAAGKASARLLRERFVEIRLGQSKLEGVKERVAKLTEGLPSTDESLQKLMKKRHDGFARAKTDATLGAAVYEKNCATCHTIANKGAKVGPQLDGIGVRGLDRLLEDILDPNRNVDQAFRASTIMLKDGKTITGLVLREEGEVVILADAQGKENRIAKDDIEERIISQLSPMPANLGEQIPEADFYNLLAYLLSQREPEKPKE